MASGPARERADAARNRDLLVAAARSAVAEVGLDVSVNEIVRRAGVGSATFYRRFASREDLLGAVLAEVLHEVEQDLRAVAEMPGPERRIGELLAVLVRHQSGHRGLSELLSGVDDGGALDGARARLRELVRQVVERARDADLVGAHVCWRDLPFLAGCLAATSSSCLGIEADRDLRDRLLGIVLAGLRAAPPRPERR